MYNTIDPDKHEIRLLSLSPGARADNIYGELLTKSLDESPCYEALSYVWGDEKNTRSIFLDGRVWNVTASLESALRHLRREDETDRILWVDALCINQGNTVERNQQVSVMRDIYETAQDVLVWFGEWYQLVSGQDEQAIVAAFDVIRQLAADQHLRDISFFQNTEQGVCYHQGGVGRPYNFFWSTRIGIAHGWFRKQSSPLTLR